MRTDLQYLDDCQCDSLMGLDGYNYITLAQAQSMPQFPSGAAPGPDGYITFSFPDPNWIPYSGAGSALIKQVQPLIYYKVYVGLPTPPAPLPVPVSAQEPQVVSTPVAPVSLAPSSASINNTPLIPTVAPQAVVNAPAPAILVSSGNSGGGGGGAPASADIPATNDIAVTAPTSSDWEKWALLGVAAVGGYLLLKKGKGK